MKTSNSKNGKNTSRFLNLNATSGDCEGEIDLTWEPYTSANSYLIQKCTGLRKPLKWVNEDVVTKSSCTISKLKSGRNYRFRVAAISRKGKSPWSNQVQKRAP